MKKRFTHEIVKSANERHYDAIADRYFQLADYLYTKDDLQEIRDRFLRLADASNLTGNFLDFGCGCGTLMRLAEGIFEEVHGIDISSEMIKHAKEHSEFAIRGDLLNLPYKDSFFCMVAGHSVLHHLYDYKLALSEAARVLKTGGVLYFDAEPNQLFSKLLRPIILLRRFFLKFRERKQGVDVDVEKIAEYHHHFNLGIDPYDLKKYLSDNGFQDIKIEYRFVKKPLIQNITFRLLQAISGFRCWYPLFRITARKI